jgi:hypothetical protein
LQPQISCLAIASLCDAVNYRYLTLAEAARELEPDEYAAYVDVLTKYGRHVGRVLIARDWDESKHPRVPAGSPEGGQFGEGGGGG